MYGRRLGWITLSVLIILSILIAGCGKAPTPAPTQSPPQVTEQPATQASPIETLPPVATEPPPTEPPATQAPTGTAGEKVVTMTFTGGDPETLNPIYAYSWTAECIFDLNLLPLWNIDNDGSYVMELAEELPSKENGGLSEDGLTITIKLRQDAVWSDGTPVTAEDAVFTYEMIMDDGNSSYSRYPWDTYVEGITAVDEHTLQIKLTGPYADWSTSLFTGITRVIPKHILEPVFQAEGTLDNAEWNRMPSVSDGPFIVTEFEPSSHLAFEANPKYWRGRPKLDKIFMRLTEDRAAQLAALASGESDIGTYIIGSEVPEIDKMGNVGIQTYANGYQVALFLNVDPKTANPGMSDPVVRRAVAFSIDRNLINDELYHGLYEIPATYWHGTVYDNPDLTPYPFDPEAAKKLLDGAGWVDSDGNGFRDKGGVQLKLRYVYIGGDETGDTMVASIQQMLANVGIEVELLPNTYEVLWAAYDQNGPMAHGQYDMTHFSDGLWYFPSPDTSYFLCDQIPSDANPYGYNWYGVCDPKLDELFKAQAVELDNAKRIEMFHEIGKIMYDQVFIIPLHTDPDVWAVNDRLANVHFSGVDPLMFAYEWDVK